jgi:putative membrane protein
MLARRSLLAFAALSVLSTGCRFFRPVDPNAGAAGPAPRSAPAAEPATSSQPAPARPQSASRRSERLSDGNIAAMVLALNNTDISYGRLAPGRAERDDIRRFAERMLTDHTGVNQKLNTLLQKLDLEAEDNVASLDMRDESAEKRDLMRELSGYQFDSTYIENEVAYHRKFLTALDNVMLPGARNAELKALLTAIRPAVASHLAHAEQVRADVLAKR